MYDNASFQKVKREKIWTFHVQECSGLSHNRVKIHGIEVVNKMNELAVRRSFVKPGPSFPLGDS